ncbi:MAG: hypothetical protein ACRENG_19185, partial [bacterium]
MRNFCLFPNLLIILMIFSAGSALAQPKGAGALAPSPAQLAVQIDSLAKTHQQTAKALHDAAATLKELKMRVDSEMAANHERVESFQEITNQLFWLFAVIGTVATVFGALVAYRGAKQQSELHGRVLRIYESQALVGEKYREHSGQILDLQESYSRGMADITTAFKDILENIKDVLGFRVEESKFALSALKEREEAAHLLPEIKRELEELRNARNAQMEDLLNDTARLKRSRHEFTEPDRELQASIFQFRLKMDGMSKLFLDKYADQPKYGLIFYYRGLIAFLESAILTANKLLRLSEKLTPFTATGLTAMPHDFRIHAAFTQFYLGLIQKNYGTMRIAHDHIEKSYRMYGGDEKGELLTLVTLAEVLSYLPEELERARNYLKELFDRVESKVKTGSLTKAEAQYIPRAHLIYGNTFYVEKRWEEAQAAYKKVLDINSKNYYAHHSLGLILQEEKRPQEAQATFDKAYQCLLDSRHLETKPERNTQIGLNALAYLCLHDVDRAAAKPYLDAVSSNLA